MTPGETVTIVARRQSEAGFPSLGLTATTDWRVIQNGVSASPSSAASVGTVGQWHFYSLTFTVSATAGPLQIVVEAAAGSDLVDAAGIDLTAYDLDSIAALFTGTAGVAVTSGVTVDNDFGRVIHGDAWHSGVLTVPLATISRWGYSDLTGMTISAGLKNAPADSSTTATAAIISAVNRTVSASWDSFPAGLALAGSDQSKSFILDIQLKHTASGRIITAIRGPLTVEWQTDTTA